MYFLQQKMPAVFRSARINMFKTLILLFMAFVICILPGIFYMNFLALGFIPFQGFNSPLFQFLNCLYFSNCIFNPFIFGFKYKRFQKGVQRIFTKFASQVHPATVTLQINVSDTTRSME